MTPLHPMNDWAAYYIGSITLVVACELAASLVVGAIIALQLGEIVRRLDKKDS